MLHGHPSNRSRDAGSGMQLDRLVQLAADHQVEVLLPLGLTPAWASARPSEPSAYRPGQAAEPADLADWRNYVATVAARYRHRVHLFEIWNEPNLVQFFTGDVKQMVKLCREAYTVIKQVAPRSRVVSPAATGIAGVRWLDQFLAAGGGDCFDVVGYHLYVGNAPPEQVLPLAAEVRRVLAAHGLAGRPIWNTETGWFIASRGSGSSDSDVRGRVFLSGTEAAATLSRALILARAAGLERFYWYAWDNFEMGLVERDGALKLPAHAFIAVQRWLVGAELVNCRGSHDGVWVCRLRRAGRPARIVWSTSGTRRFDVGTTVGRRGARSVRRAARGEGRFGRDRLGTAAGRGRGSLISRLRILIVHASYQQSGGEDTVVTAEKRLLREAGHSVSLLEASNDSIAGARRTVAAGLSAVYSLSGKRRVARAIATHLPDVVHVHNTFPLLSPSVFDACREAGVPAIQTLHNYRLVCANALLFRDGHRCEECVDAAIPWPAVRHGCYRDSRPASAATAAMIAFHRHRGTFRRLVNAHIALSRFQRDIILRAGIPAKRVFVKPTGLADPGWRPDHGPGRFALYAGRLAPEKGVARLIEAYDARGPAVPLQIVGDGPLRADLERAVVARGAGDRITFHGRLGRDELMDKMREARFLVFPTECYEALPLAPIEAAACGRPVVASRIGAVPEIVDHGTTGWLVPPGSPAAWRQAIETAWVAHDECIRRGVAARALYEERFAEAASGTRLVSIYRSVLSPTQSIVPN